MRKALYDDTGIALLLMLWVLTFLSIIAAEFCHSMRVEVNTTANLKEDAQAFYLAEAGTARAIMELLKMEKPLPTPSMAPAEEEPPWRINLDMPPIPFAGGQYRVRIDNESGKINLNYADEKTLRLALNSFNLDDKTKDIISDSILDWRDKDDLHRVSGAENEYYQTLPKPYACKNGNYEAVEELLLVRGVTPALFHSGLKDLFTVFGKKPPPRQEENIDGFQDPPIPQQKFDFNKININAASRRMLMSLPGLTEEAAQKILSYRLEKDISSFADLMGLVGADAYVAVQSYIAFVNCPYYTIRARGGVNEALAGPEIQVTIKIDNKSPLGYQVIRRSEG